MKRGVSRAPLSQGTILSCAPQIGSWAPFFFFFEAKSRRWKLLSAAVAHGLGAETGAHSLPSPLSMVDSPTLSCHIGRLGWLT